MSVNISILAVGDPAVNVYVDPRYEIVSSYKARTGVNVKFDIIPWADYYTTMMDAFEGKQDYDIIMVAGHLWLKDFVVRGYISELNYPDDSRYDKDDILPTVMEEMKVYGKTYLYPSFCDGHIVLYRRSIARQVLGYEPDKGMTTDALIDGVKRINGFRGMAGIALKAHPSEIFLDVLPYLRGEGIDAFDPETYLPTFNNSKGLAGISKYMSLRDYAPLDTNSYGNDEVRIAFQQKKAVFAVTWGGQLGVVMDDRCLEPEDVGFATLRTPWNVTWSFAVNARSTNKSAAESFLAYLTSKDIDRIVGGYAGSPVRISSYKTDGGLYPWYGTLLDMIKNYARPLPKMINSGDKLGCLYSQLAEAFNNKKSIEAALEDAEKAISEIR